MPNPNLPINAKYNTYVGARYVPKFGNPDLNYQWTNERQYEPLTIVLNNGNSFTSTTFVPIGVDINNQTYWAETGNYNAQVEQYRQEVLVVKDDIENINTTLLRPDNFEGDTDVEKLQACFNSAAGNPVNILIDRDYIIDAPVTLENMSDASKNQIVITGFGGSLQFKSGGHFVGATTSGANGGFTWIGVKFVGLDTNGVAPPWAFFPPGENLIRFNFIGCFFVNFGCIISGTDYVQSWYFIDCTFRQIKWAIQAYQWYNVVFQSCTFEQTSSVIVKQGTDDTCYCLVIRDCCIEGNRVQAPIIIGACNTVVIEGNYFEANNDDIIFTNGIGCKNVSIRNNMSGAGLGAFVTLPGSFTGEFSGFIENNCVYTSTGKGLFLTYRTGSETPPIFEKLIIKNNYGNIQRLYPSVLVQGYGAPSDFNYALQSGEYEFNGTYQNSGYESEIVGVLRVYKTDTMCVQVKYLGSGVTYRMNIGTTWTQWNNV